MPGRFCTGTYFLFSQGCIPYAGVGTSRQQHPCCASSVVLFPSLSTFEHPLVPCLLCILDPNDQTSRVRSNICFNSVHLMQARGTSISLACRIATGLLICTRPKYLRIQFSCGKPTGQKIRHKKPKGCIVNRNGAGQLINRWGFVPPAPLWVACYSVIGSVPEPYYRVIILS